ncbi:MAG TPA: cytochrome c peroxidase [Blastocatellia bacterium]|nr:cytochrome c peroxidase [Blastocatellia bacterium]
MKRLKLCVVILLATLAPLVARADNPGNDTNTPLGIPREVWAYFIPKDSPLTPQKVELGRKLFFDARLSANGKVSCATCHDPKLGFADAKPVAEGIDGKRGARNTPTILNAMFNASQFWDGRADSLDAQAVMPLVNPDEMGNRSLDEVVARLRKMPDYSAQFEEVFNRPVTIADVGSAIAAFERTLVSGNSAFDRYVAGDRTALSESALRGLGLFRGKGRCAICHSVNQSFPFLTDQNYRNTGIAANNPDFNELTKAALQLARSGATPERLEALRSQKGASELGRFLITGNALDIGAFRTPSLRNVELTAPYFHDGSAATLLDVVRYYSRGGNESPSRDWELHAVALTEAEQLDLVEFLKSLTGDEARKEARSVE